MQRTIQQIQETRKKEKKPAYYRNMTPCNQKQPSLCMMIGTNSHKPQQNRRFKKTSTFADGKI
jgi:hypothetical protein